MEDKTSRQMALRQLLNSKAVESQSEVVEFLEKQGIPATQSSVSRDFRDLGVVKVGGRYQLGEDIDVELPDLIAEKFSKIRRFITKIQPVSENLFVIKTSTATAQFVASAIDHSSIDGVAGTVAGDDTIFVATMNRSTQMYLEALLLGVEPKEINENEIRG